MESLAMLPLTGTECIANKQTDRHSSLYIYILAEVPDIIQNKIHYCMPNMIENDVLVIFYDLLMLDVVK